VWMRLFCFQIFSFSWKQWVRLLNSTENGQSVVHQSRNHRLPVLELQTQDTLRRKNVEEESFKHHYSYPLQRAHDLQARTQLQQRNLVKRQRPRVSKNNVRKPWKTISKTQAIPTRSLKVPAR
jgi:hypothetical protein